MSNIISTKGKNFSGNNATGKRRKSDFYETPYSLTNQFLDVENFDTNYSILEPAFGGGAITKILQERNFNNLIYYDKEVDFLKESDKYDYVVTNPPFSLAKDFILKAKEITKYKFAMLLPLSYLHGKERYDLIYNDTNFPLKKVYVFTRYPMLGDPLRDDGKYRTGMMVYAWFVWDITWVGPPIIDWIDNQEYVLNKGNKK